MIGRCRLASLTLAMALLAAGCGSAASGASSSNSAPGATSLATSIATQSTSWAVTVMGGSAAQHDNFWQVFERPAPSAPWRLVTPPGVASNGGLVLASLGGPSVVAGFRPSQALRVSPLATTRDGGSHWSPGEIGAGLADVPDALSAAQASGKLLALLSNGTAALSGPGGAGLLRLSSKQSIATSAAGRRCGLTRLTAAAFGPSGVPLLAGACSHSLVGIFARAGSGWRQAGPALPAGASREDVTVLRLTATGSGNAALLVAGHGGSASLYAAWTNGNGGQWVLSPPFSVGSATVRSASFGPGGAAGIVLSGGHAVTVGSDGTWHQLPALPAGTVTLAGGPGGSWESLAVHRATLTAWRLAGSAWHTAQTIKVPIAFGSSG